MPGDASYLPVRHHVRGGRARDGQAVEGDVARGRRLRAAHVKERGEQRRLEGPARRRRRALRGVVEVPEALARGLEVELARRVELLLDVLNVPVLAGGVALGALEGAIRPAERRAVVRAVGGVVDAHHHAEPVAVAPVLNDGAVGHDVARVGRVGQRVLRQLDADGRVHEVGAGGRAAEGLAPVGDGRRAVDPLAVLEARAGAALAEVVTVAGGKEGGGGGWVGEGRRGSVRRVSSSERSRPLVGPRRSSGSHELNMPGP